MKKLRYFLLFLVLILVAVVVWQYPRLNIISGYAAKNMCSCMFEAGRSQDFVAKTDNNFPPIDIATYEVDTIHKTVTASVLGLMKRKAVYHEDLGCQLALKNASMPRITYFPAPHNCPLNPYYPYGNEDPQDTLFANIDYKKLNVAVHNAFDPKGKDSLMTRALVVIYKDHIIAEKYDEGFDKNAPILGWSMTKSVMATLFGIMEKQGKINRNATQLFPEWAQDERKNITIHSLLQMSSGLEWNEDYNHISDVTRMLFMDKDMSQMQLHKDLKFPIGSHWNYSSGTTNLLGKYLRNQFTSHQAYLDFPVKELFDKLGMSSAMIETDLEGNYVYSSYGWATARHWGKLGLLYLHKGNWNGEQILSESWVQYVSTPCKDSKGEYGAHFWLNAGGILPDAPRDMYSMQGHQGQKVYIIPSKDMVIVRMGLNEETEIDFNKMLKEIFGALK
ncbi:MAG: serine hydrolase [Flavobacteriaceae bacterium]|nr:serine hydrolase [Flavobacteriaceae bacterium]